MPKFSTHVALMNPEYQPVSFAPGDEVPEWALDQVGAHCLDADAAPAPEPDKVPAVVEVEPTPDPDEPDSAPDFTGTTPARRGRPRKQ